MAGLSHLYAELTVGFKDRLSRPASAMAGKLASANAMGERSFHSLRAAAGVAGRGIDHLANRYTAFITGAAAIGTGRALVNLEARLTQLGIQAQKSGEEVDVLKARVFAVASQPDIRLDPSELISALERIVEKTGDLELAEGNLVNIAKAIRASAASGADIGALAADFSEKFQVRDPQVVLKVLDGIVNQGKAGAFTLQNMATQGERVTAAYGQLGRTGPEAILEMGAALQLIRKSVGGPEQAATALEALIRTLNDADKVKLLKQGGIRLADPDDPSRLRSVLDIMRDLVRVTKGNPVLLSQVFDSEAMRALNAASLEFRNTGGIASIEKYLAVARDGQQINADAARAAATTAAALQSLSAAWTQVSDAALTPGIRAVADFINGLDPATIRAWADGLIKGAAALGAMVIAIKAIKAVGSVAGVLGGIRAGAKGGLDGAAGVAGSAGVVPVFVTNMPAGGFGGGAAAGAGGAAGAATKYGPRVAKFGRVASKLAPVLAIIAGTAESAAILLDDSKSSREKAVGVTSTAAGAFGAFEGAKYGALLGAPAGPVGIGVGAVTGGIVGYLALSEIAELVSKYAFEKFDLFEAPRGQLDINVNAPPGTRVESRNVQGLDLNLQMQTGLTGLGGL